MPGLPNVALARRWEEESTETEMEMAKAEEQN